MNAKDVANPEDLADPSASCLIKMSEPSIEGLKQAFLDPQSRIRLLSEAQPPDHSRVVAAAWEGGFLDETRIRFNENLNVLIGGRGTGKSTVIESLRYALDREAVGEEAAQTHQKMLRAVVKPGTKISVLIYSPHPAPRHYLIERTFPNPPVVKSETGDILSLTPADVVPNIEIYGQHEIGEITKDPTKLTKLLSRSE